MATTRQPLNPYIAGKAVGGERGFFGRQDILREVERTLTSPDQNALVLFGQRRIGKTSILLQLERRLPSLPFVPVYFDLMDKARLPLNRVLYELAATAAPLVGISPPSGAEFEGSDDAFRRVFLPAVYKALGQSTPGKAQPLAPRQSKLREFKPLGTGHRFGVMEPVESPAEPVGLSSARRLVFLFDEFDVLDVAAEEKLPDTAAARAFFPYLRELMAGEPRLGFVFVVGRKTDELSTEFLTTFKAARYRRVSVLEPEAARELITLAQREGSLNFTDEAIERILALTAGHPYFTQLLCQTFFDRAYDAEPEGVPTVDVADVEAVVPDVLEAGSQAFEWVWNGLPPAERIIFSAIATHADETTVLTEDEIMAILQDAGIRILIKELALAPRTLVDWEMLKEVEGGYRFFVELMRRWVAEQKPLDHVKDELDQVVPLADMLYRSGAAFYGASDVKSAIGQLQRALEVNPNHLKARLLLGIIYREQGRLEEAVAEFEAAYRYDEAEGRYELVRTLLGKHVVLLIDEFDSLLTHPNFNSAEFFGGLRSISSRTESLQLITASRTSIAEMNRRTQEINPLGSPYFNTFGEVVLRPFSEKAVTQLLDQALEGSGVQFGKDDRAYVRRLSGGHPYRVQTAASALFDAIADELEGEERYATAGEYFYERAAAHFDDLWQHLDDAARTVMVILALVELGGMAQRREFSFGEIERPQRFDPELKKLAKLGLVEKVGKGWQWDKEHLLLWQEERWRVASGGFVWWLADVAIAGTRDIPGFQQWLHDQEVRGYLLTRKQWETLRDWAGKVPTSVVSGAGELARLLLGSILKQERGS